MKPNEKFTLTVQDMDLIENALLSFQRSLKSDSDKKEIINLRAKLHHQKNWYRPKDNYVGG